MIRRRICLVCCPVWKYGRTFREILSDQHSGRRTAVHVEMLVWHRVRRILRYNCLQVWQVASSRWLRGWRWGRGRLRHFWWGRWRWSIGRSDVHPIILLRVVVLEVSLARGPIDLLSRWLETIPPFVDAVGVTVGGLVLISPSHFMTTVPKKLNHFTTFDCPNGRA